MQKTEDRENLLAASSYLLWFISGLLLLAVEKKSEFVRFHAIQSVILFGGVSILLIILAFIPIIGWLVALVITPTLMLICFFVWLVLMWKAFNGEYYKVPYVGDLAQKQLKRLSEKS